MFRIFHKNCRKMLYLFLSNDVVIWRHYDVTGKINKSSKQVFDISFSAKVSSLSFVKENETRFLFCKDMITNLLFLRVGLHQVSIILDRSLFWPWHLCPILAELKSGSLELITLKLRDFLFGKPTDGKGCIGLTQ